ncbi:hypothetical protein AABB24_034882 [Solanum stoloniferum]|uniref:HAT C-terminal dimerisation domain-containing protein n=1 Tax=Solanum stoloniferum TaxID=62892 RepID=A0ABD2RHF7_9SOLN
MIMLEKAGHGRKIAIIFLSPREITPIVVIVHREAPIATWKGSDNITNEEGIPQLLNWWRARGTQFPKFSRMVKDVLAIQGSSVASEAAFSAARFQIGDHIYSLAEDSLEISVLFRDWINDERRNQGLPKLDSQYELFIDSTIGCGSDDGMELQDRKRALPRPVVDHGQSITELEKGFTGLYNY